MTKSHLVVDGSNIATEGRATPSLKQLDEAVRALLDDREYEAVTVVVDATFGHRIDPSEQQAFEEAILAGELLTPPAGAIGRGDAFILQIAERADADVFSNDSFQEFHGSHTWLFDEGRLIGGKPVPHVGWVFVLRAPVRGPTSRRAVRDAKKAPPKATKAKASPPASKTTSRPRSSEQAPTRVVLTDVIEPAAAGGGRRRRRRGGGGGGEQTGTESAARVEPRPQLKAAGRAPRSSEPLNSQSTYASFVVDHPIGSVVTGVVERFSSHGAYIGVGDASCYVPLRELGDPPPRSAREVLTIGETRTFEVRRFDPARKGIDVVPLGELTRSESGSDAAKAAGRRPVETRRKQVPDAEEAPVSPAAKKAAKKKAPAKKRAAAKKKAPAKKRAVAKKKSPAKKKAAAKKKSPAKKKAAAKKKAPAKRKAAKKKAPAKKKAAKKKAPAKKKAAAKKKAPAKKKAAKRKAPAKRKAAAKKR
jgi:hypothetical protein